ncbi:ion transporter [Alcanivorax sp. N3-2A]|nr:ion transporter [Alcanivorax sp. N3-2A]|tara:strand:- start:117030 stop:117863 length:834 start_codon:yes stop_codon:yes gene_type:complete
MNQERPSLRDRWWHIIFGTDTEAGRRFDQLLIVAILASVVAVMLDSVASIHQRYGAWLYGIEWFFTLLFTVEYGIRLWVSERPARYARSFFGVVDLLSVIPTYLSLLIPGTNFLLTIRALRVLRVFRVLKLAAFMSEANQLGAALIRTRRKIAVFMFSVLVVIVIFGSLMYVVEGPVNGFTSIPRSIYWAIVTVTTVGYGDISPQTPLGQVVASLAMITGYAIIAVPTGIITAEISAAHVARRYQRECPGCHRHDHDPDARFCKQCGSDLPKPDIGA